MKPVIDTLRYYIPSFLYLCIGGFVTIELLNLLITDSSMAYWILIIPMLFITILITVIGIVNMIVRFHLSRENIYVKSYDTKDLIILYVKCWLVIVCGLILSVDFYWLHDLLPQDIQDLIKGLYNLFYLICAFLTVLGLVCIFKTENLNEIRLRNTENENQLLKAQLNPHFLYNTLNNIDALIWIDQEKASSAVNTLSSLMRYLTYSSRQEKITLKEEAEHLSQLVELQKLRISKENVLNFDIDIEDENAMISPLLMIPLVENCFKHVGNLEEENAINISLKESANQLTFVTSNNVATANNDIVDNKNVKSDAKTSSKNKKGGVGLNVLRRRLQILYSNRFTFSTELKDGRYIAVLNITL